MTSNELQTLFQKYYSELCKFAAKLTNEYEPHDIVMDAFINVFENPRVIADHSHVRNYLYLVVRNRCVDVIRRSKVLKMDSVVKHNDELFTEGETIQNTVENRQIVVEVIKIVNLLPRQQKMVIELSFIGEASREEIAEIMEVSQNTVKNHKSAAIKSLKLKLKISQ